MVELKKMLLPQQIHNNNKIFTDKFKSEQSGYKFTPENCRTYENRHSRVMKPNKKLNKINLSVILDVIFYNQNLKIIKVLQEQEVETVYDNRSVCKPQY